MPAKILGLVLLILVSSVPVGSDNYANAMSIIFPPDEYDPVLKPQNFPAFKGISNSNDFSDSWGKNRNWVLSKLAHAAYFEEDQLRKALAPFLKDLSTCKNGAQVTMLCVYSKGSAQGFLLIWADIAVLSFRGTQSDKWEDLKEDLKLVTVPFKTIEVHKGFLESVESLWESDVLPDLNRLKKGTKIWVTGHSLGGGMATIAGMKYEFEEVVTFGEPRVGFGVEKEFIVKGHTRFVNGNDPVTKIPGENLIGPPHFLYKHHGDNLHICDPINGSTSILNRAGLLDHSILAYSKFLGDGVKSCKE